MEQGIFVDVEQVDGLVEEHSLVLESDRLDTVGIANLTCNVEGTSWFCMNQV